jgi:hypothetical protein
LVVHLVVWMAERWGIEYSNMLHLHTSTL